MPEFQLGESSDGLQFIEMAELYALRDELIRVGEIEGRSLTNWLMISPGLSLVSFAVITLLASRRISRPLALITDAVRAVARGDWKSHVPGHDRADEVGDIARAVIVLQRSLEERDRLRSDIVHAESVKKRREALEDAIRRFDRTMRSVLLSVSDTVEAMDETARDLARMSAVAEGEAAETAFVSEHTVSNVSTLRSATERLSASIAETVDHIKQTNEAIGASSSVAQSAFSKAEQLSKTTNDTDAVVRMIDDIAAQTNALVLNASASARQRMIAPQKTRAGCTLSVKRSEEARQIVEKARTDASQERQRAFDDLRRVMADISIEAATRVLGKELSDPNSQRQLVEQFIATAGNGTN